MKIRPVLLALAPVLALGAAQPAHAGVFSFVKRAQNRVAARRDFKAFIKGQKEAHADYKDSVYFARSNHGGAVFGINLFLPLLWGPGVQMISTAPREAAWVLGIAGAFEAAVDTGYAMAYRNDLRQGRANALTIAAKHEYVPTAGRLAWWKSSGILPADPK